MKKAIALVIYANPDYYPPTIYAAQLLAKEYTVVLIGRNQDAAYVDYAPEVVVCRLGKYRTSRQNEQRSRLDNLTELARFFFSTLKLVVKYRCRVVYAYCIYSAALGFVVSRLTGRRFVYHNHDIADPKLQQNLIGRVQCAFERFAARRADLVVFPSPHRALWYARLAQLRTLPLVAMNAPLLQRELSQAEMEHVRKRYGWWGNTKVVLYQGAVTEGHDLLTAVSSVPLWPDDCVLLICGYLWEAYAEQLRRRIRELKLEGRAVIEPYRQYRPLFSLTPGAFLGLAMFEHNNINNLTMAGASNKMLEYITCGVPFVCNDETPFREVFNESSTYFAAVGSPESLADAVRRAVSHPEEYALKKMACRRLHADKYHYDAQFAPVAERLREFMRA